jgi:Legume lectin domain/Chitobiase/beta-hexosaminidase C-terminal domain
MCVRSSFRGSTALPTRFFAVINRLTDRFLLNLLAMALFCCGPVASLVAQTPTPITVPTWRYDLAHVGQNTNETALTPSNVQQSSFGKLFSVAVDGTLYSQPLYVPGLTINGAAHNVIFVATGHDSLYAFDADSNGGANANPLWKVSLLTAAHGAGAGATTVPWQDTASPDVAPEIGITGTPVINPATNTLYVVAATKESGVYFSRLHAINILTGAEKANSPVVISATVAGTGNGSSGGKLSFSPLWQNQRSALNYYNGYVYFAYGAHGDNGPWHGWIFSYNATTLAQAAVVCTSPNGYGAGVWEAGAGMPIDDDGAGGRMFLTTGNGTFNTFPPFSESTEIGESIVGFNLSNGGLQATDGFTSFNGTHLNNGDLDQGSGGLLMVPDQQGSYPHELIQAGKEGRILVLNRDHLGGYAGASAPSNTNIPQDIPSEINGLWSTPAYWNGNVYTWGNGDVPKLFKMNSGVLSTEPSSKSTITSAFPGASFSVSSNGAQDGVAWAARTDQFNTKGAAVLYAWDANDLTDLLYASSSNAKRDAAGAANKFAIPIVTNGKVYLVANGQLDVYGLFNGEPTAAEPVITPDGGSFAGSQSVSLSTTTSSASIYYTLDGSVPTPASTLYSESITVSVDTTVRAIASAPGFVQSGVSSASFTFTDQTPPVTFLPAAGTYATTQQVTLSNTDTTSKVYYTTDSSTPTASSNLYTGPITVSASTTINAIAIDPNLQNSNVTAAAYIIQAGGSSINFGSGFSSTAGLTLNGSTVATNDTRLQLTNGLQDEAGSMFWNQPIGIQSFTTDFEFQLSLAQGDGFTFTIQNIGPNALGGGYSGLGYAGIGKSVAIKFDFYNNAGEGNDSTGVFTNGALPTVPAVDMTSSGIELNSGDSIQAHITYDGTTLTMNLLDLVNNKTFTLTQAINIPQIVGGNTAYVGFTGGTGGATSSQKILTWTYTAQTAAAGTSVPVFSPAAGSYSTPQSVALSSTTAGAKIYYTTNGTAPTTASSAYTGPIAVGTGSTTIEAIAVASGLSQSAVATAKYVVGITPVINFGSGFTSAANLSMNDAAVITSTVLQVTLEGAAANRGSAWFTQPVSINAFTTDFQFQLLNATADGFTFTIQNDGVTAIGPAGSGLGYGASKPGGTGGLAKSIAIKFDIYNNLGEGTDSTGFYSNGASPTTPATDMTASGVTLRSGHVFHAHITYDGTNLTLVLTDTTTNASFTKTAAINIPSIVGSGTAYVGFTGSFGGLSMTTNILNWTLTNP